MAHFHRRSPAPVVSGGYRSFRPYVREDFIRKCAYCLLSEILSSGEENFELDHFRPKSRFPDLKNDFHNIYYACHPCNFTKRDAWPSEELQASGVSLVDLCKDEFDNHFRPKIDGSWEGTTESARYTIEMLRLNRKHLVNLRSFLATLGVLIHDEGELTEEDLRLRIREKYLREGNEDQ